MTPGHSLEPGWRVALAHLEEKERGLQQICLADEVRHTGLVDLESRLKLCQTRLAMCLVMLDAMTASRKAGIHRRLYAAAARKARDAVGELEELRAQRVSEDQKSLITGHAEYQEALRLLEQLVNEGGGVLLEPLETDPAREKVVLRAVSRAIRKYARPDDRYTPIGPARRRGRFHGLLAFLFPTLMSEGDGGTPCGIDEDQEGLGVSERMRMPLSQAIHYTERELLPSLRKALANDPGEPLIQERIHGLERQLQELHRLRFTPRSTPVILEKGFYTEWVSDYTAEGELLVSVMLPVTYRTGTNLSRAQELTFAEVVRRLAGKGICRRLDEQYRHLRSLASGIRGSSRLPSSRLDPARAFIALKREFPALDALESREEFRRLLDLAAGGSRRALERGIRRLLAERETGAGAGAFLTE